MGNLISIAAWIWLLGFGFRFLVSLVKQRHLFKALWCLNFNYTAFKQAEEEFNRKEETKASVKQDGAILRDAIQRSIGIVIFSGVTAIALGRAIHPELSPAVVEWTRIIGYGFVLLGVASEAGGYFKEAQHQKYATLAEHLDIFWHKGMYLIGVFLITFSYVTEF